MSLARHGRRVLTILAASLAGCQPGVGDPSRVPPSLQIAGPSTPALGRVLVPPPGATGPVAALAWGGPGSARRLAVLWADGKLGLYRPDVGETPVSWAQTRGQVVAVVAADRVVTGGPDGLTAWDVGRPGESACGTLPCGPVASLLSDPQARGDLLVGMADGRLLLVRPPQHDATFRVRAECAPWGAAASVSYLARADEAGTLMVGLADGRAARYSADLGGRPDPLPGLGRAPTPCSSRLARIVDGPAIAIEDRDGRTQRIALERRPSGLALARRRTMLVVSCEGGWLLLDPRDRRPAVQLVSSDDAGPTLAAVDPADSAGRRLAIASGGKAECIDLEELRSRSRPRPTDDVAEWALRPELRPSRPRIGTAHLGVPTALAARLEEARQAVDRGDWSGLADRLRTLEAEAGDHRAAAAEVRVLSAALHRRTGWSPGAVRQWIEPAREAFARLGATDREADLRLWEGLLLAPGPGDPTDPGDVEAALPHFTQAADLYRAGGTGLARQARLAEALRAWCFLRRGDLRRAAIAFEPVAEAARVDPVLGQVLELDRLAAVLAAARRDWSTAEAADARLLGRLDAATDRVALRREAASARLGALAALGRWAEARDLLEASPADDPSRPIRRVIAARRAGQVVPIPAEADGDATNSHVRGILLAEADRPDAIEEAATELGRAAAEHRLAGREELAEEADLQRAEVLERLGRHHLALDLHATVARSLKAATAGARSPPASRPLLHAASRADRGVARCALAIGRAPVALAAFEAADRVPWVAEAGEGAVSGFARGVPRDDRSSVDTLRAARRAADRAAGPRPDELATIARLEAVLATHHRAPWIDDVRTGLDPAALALGPTEAVLAYAPAGPEALVGLLIRRGTVEAHVLPATRGEIRRAILAWRRTLGDGGRSLRSGEPRGPEALLGLAPEPEPIREPTAKIRAPSWEAYLHDALIAPFESGLSGVGQLLIVPGDATAALPFEVVGRSTRLVQRFRVSYAPNLTLISLGRGPARDDATTGTAALIGATDDAARLALAWRDAGIDVDPASEVVARPERWLDLPPARLGLLHASAPATLDPSLAPWAEADLRLAPGSLPRVDGRLTAADVLTSTPPARVLSLALGRPDDRPTTTGPGLRSLARAGVAAGADSVILSLWDPPASSSVAFYTALAQALATGSSPAEALECARLHVAANPAHRDPVHWAGYVLYGSRP